MGVERMTAWADLLDQINVFPAADGDTGRNLAVSLSPLRHGEKDPGSLVQKLMFTARGNSGNIAAHFFSGFLDTGSSQNMLQAADLGRCRAWQAVGDPRPGTMLTVFDALVEGLDRSPVLTHECIDEIISRLEKAVQATPQLLPELKEAGVVDSGALGMFIFFEGFFRNLIKSDEIFRPVTDRFQNTLRVSSSFKGDDSAAHCVTLVIRSDKNHDLLKEQLSSCGTSLVAAGDHDHLKIHLHAFNVDAVRTKAGSLGQILSWSDEKIKDHTHRLIKPDHSKSIHIMTDAAGSLTWSDAQKLGVTLLNSYILTRRGSFPETLADPSEIYASMRLGEKITTAQASVFERNQCYASLLSRYEQVLYLCTGSVYTGNYHTALAWKKENDPDGRFTVIDTGAASGRLAVIAMTTAGYAEQTDDPKEVICFARCAAERAREYIFLDRLCYLAAGGRLSKPGAFFGDMLHMKPIITPAAQGPQKAGIARNPEDQIRFALDKLSNEWKRNEDLPIMLEYSDNRQWVETRVKDAFLNRYPSSEIMLQPLSLTSGVHMGPGTWGVAFMTDKP